VLPAMIEQLDTRLASASVVGVGRLASSEKLGDLIRGQRDSSLREKMLTALLSRRDKNSLGEYLTFVIDMKSRDEALAALHSMADPPVNALLAEFDHSRVSFRLAAATAIGQVCHGDVAPTLLRMVDEDDHRREALAALTFCHDP